jgi:uncharacterized protein involved in response to NO
VISPKHPFWLVGFRPFFSLACIAGCSLPILWILILKGVLPAPSAAYSPTQWHAHEMFYGFGWAVLGGFLLTSTKNWVNVRGYHGGALIYLTAAWLVERLVIAFGGHLPAPLFWLGSQLFLISIVGFLLATLIRHRHTDGYRRDNLFFLLILPTFALAKILILLPDSFHLGWTMTLGLFRVAFLVMLERTLTQFMKSIFKVEILRHPLLDNSIKVLGLMLVASGLMPPALAAAFSLLLGILLLGRFAFWHPLKAFSRLDVGIMYLGYLAITGQLLIEASSLFFNISWVGSVAVHVFTFGAMGLVIPAMMIRISNGHTGRKVAFGAYEKTVLWIMILAFALRLIGPQLAPEIYLRWLDMAATCWFVAFLLLGWRFIPYFYRPRIDGKDH